jgi:hypothetical protein
MAVPLASHLKWLPSTPESCVPTCAVALAVQDAHSAQEGVFGHAVGQAADHARHVRAMALAVCGRWAGASLTKGHSPHMSSFSAALSTP